MRIKAVIDRIEGNIAILLAGDEEIAVKWPKSLLPDKAGEEGDILWISLVPDPEATLQAKAEADALLKTLLDSQ